MSAASIASTADPTARVAIVDYKTGKARDQEDADESLQLSLYAIAAQEKWGYKVGALIFHNLEENVPVITTRTEANCSAPRDRVEAAAQGIADGKFEAKPGNALQFLRLSKSVPGEREAHSASAWRSWPASN